MLDRNRHRWWWRVFPRPSVFCQEITWKVQASECRQLTHQRPDQPILTHTHTHTHAKSVTVSLSASVCQPPWWSSPSCLPSAPLILPHHAGLCHNETLLTQSHSASVAIATWLHALHPHQVCVVGGKKTGCPCVFTSGRYRNSASPLIVLADLLVFRYW